MRNTTKIAGATVLALAVTALAITSGYTSGSPRDPETPPSVADVGSTRAEQLELATWPETVDASYGYAWGSYGLLSEFTEVENTVDAVDAYWKSGSGYACFIERRMRFESGTGAALNLVITRCPNYKAAKRRALHAALSKSPPAEFNGQSYNLQLGDVSIVRDVPVVPGSYTGQDSNNLVFIRGNMIVDAVLTGSGAGFTAAELCLEIDTDILQQYAACGGNYPVPTATVAIDDPNGDLTQLVPPARTKTTPVSVSTSHPQNAQVQMHVFVARRIEPRIMGENGIVVPDPSGTPWWWVDLGGEEFCFDSARNPSTLTVQDSNDDGNWQMVAAAWGPNMVPTFATADFVIIR